jgi:hypothetical protein
MVTAPPQLGLRRDQKWMEQNKLVAQEYEIFFLIVIPVNKIYSVF